MFAMILQNYQGANKFSNENNFFKISGHVSIDIKSIVGKHLKLAV